MARILGLDLGAHTVKMVVIETAMRGHAVKQFFSAPRPAPTPGEPHAALRAALTELTRDGMPTFDQVVVALPGPTLATHSVTLPFVEAKRIDQTLPFEVESQIPFELSDVVFDYQLGAIREKKSELVVGVVRKDEMQSLLDLLRDFKLDPRIVSHPALAYQNLLTSTANLFEQAPTDELVAIIDIGHERTGVCVGRKGVGAEFARTFPGGGKDLSRALATELKLPLEEAEAMKESRGALRGAASGPEAERLAAILSRALQPVLREIRSTLKAHESRSRKNPAMIFVCGGTANLPGIDAFLSDELGIPARTLSLPMDAQNNIPGAFSRSALQPYALALRGLQSGAKAPRFNLRRGPFAFKGDFDYLRDRRGLLIAYAAAILLLMLASGILRNSLLARREEALNAELCEVTTRVLGTCEKDFDRALALLKGKESPAAAIPKHSAVELLANVVKQLPSEVVVEFDQVLIEQSRISLRVTTDSPKQIDRINTAIKGNPCFREVNQGKMERSSDQKIQLKMEIDVQCPDVAAGRG